MWSNGLGIASAHRGDLRSRPRRGTGDRLLLAGIIPSATPDLNQPPFNSTLNGLQNDLANAVTQAGAAVDAQSYEVRQNYGMLRLVGQMTGPSGPWNEINTAGLQGSMNQGFALWAYKQLLPTMLERDVVTDCASGNSEDVNCSWTGFAGGIGSRPNLSTYLNSPHTENMSVR